MLFKVNLTYVRFEVLTVVKMTMFRVITRLDSHVDTSILEKHTEDGNSRFLWNIGIYRLVYMVSQPEQHCYDEIFTNEKEEGRTGTEWPT
jgi:hypothetical protein